MTGDAAYQPPAVPNDELARLAELVSLGVLDSRPEAEFDNVVALASLACQTPIALVSLVDEQRQWFKARCGLDAEQTDRSISFCGHAILQAGVFEVPDAQADPRFAGNPLVTGAPHIRFYAGAPLVTAGGHRLGTLCVIDTVARSLDTRQREQLVRLARLAMQLLESRRDRKQAETKAATLDALLEYMPSAVVVCDARGELSHFNRLARAWHGVDPRRLPPEQWAEHFDLFRPDGQTHLETAEIPLLRAFNGDEVDAAEIVIKAHGQPPRHVECYGRRILADGRPVGALVVMNDITAVQATHQALERERRDLQTILDGTHAGTGRWNVQTGEVVFNERWAQMCGYTLAELAPVNFDTWLRMAHPDDLVEAGRALRAHFRGESPHYDAVCRMRHKDGHWVWIHGRGRVYAWTPDGAPLWMAGTHVDVSALKAAEAEALSARAHLEALIRASVDVAIIATDPDGLITVFNPGAERILGYSEAEMVGRCSPGVFHLPSEVEARGAELGRELGREVQGFDVFVHAAREGRTETRDWTYVRKDGEHRQVRLSVSCLADAEGAAIGFLGMAVDQTEQLAAEREARLQAEHFRGAFKSVAVGMALVSLEGRWMAVNDALCERLGYAREELLATTFQQVTHPDDLDADLQLLHELVAGRIPHYQLVKRYLRKDGRLIWAKLSVALVRDDAGAPLHFVSQIHDITAERQAQEALEASEARLRGLFELSPIGIALADADSGRFLDANYALIAQTGYARHELLALSDRDLTPPEHHDRLQAAAQELEAIGRFGPYEKLYRREDGSTYPVRVQGTRIHDLDGRPAVWSLIEDVSERHRVDRMKADFVATVSHELRTPLTSISGALRLITGGALGEVPASMREMLDIASGNSQRLSQLVNDLLDMDKLAAGQLDFNIRQLSLDRVLQHAVDGMRAYAEPLGVRIVREGDPACRTVLADEARLLQVLTNLLSNACKHSPSGSVVELRHACSPEGHVVLSVVDQGSGIPAAFRPRIFEKFAQADQGDARLQAGTGLGLAICKELVDRMGGVIGFESVEGQGSHFWVRLPTREGTQAARRGAGERLRILHVEDDPHIAGIAAAQLRAVADVEPAASMAEAHALLRMKRYDLLLLDLRLPDGSGQALWETLHHAQAGVPVLVVSGHEVPHALASEVAGVLAKSDQLGPQLLQAVWRLFPLDAAVSA